MSTETSRFKDPISSHAVHRVYLEKVIATYTPAEQVRYAGEMTEEKIRQLLRRMVELYNLRQGDNPSCYRFTAVKLDDSWSKEANGGYRIWSVWRKIIHPSIPLAGFLRAAGAQEDFSGSAAESILFFYKTTDKDIVPCGDVYAMTDGTNAWSLLAPYRDPVFARVVARQMLEGNFSRIKTRPLVGDKIQKESKQDQGHYTGEASQGFAWVEGVTASVKAKSLPQGLERFSNDPPKLTLLEKSLRFHASLTPVECVVLLDHYSSLYRQAFQDPAAGDDSLSYLTSLQPADSSLLPALEQALCLELWRIFSSEQDCETGLRFAAKFNEDFYKAESYSFSLIKNAPAKPTSKSKKSAKPKKSTPWRGQLSAAELVRKLAERPPFSKMAAELKGKMSEERKQELSEEFVDEVKKCRLYYFREKKCHSLTFIEGFEGEVMLENGEHFFHVKGDWMQPRIDFFANLHRKFIKLLDKHLIRPNHRFIRGDLPITWKGHTDSTAKREDVEGKYNLSYINEPNCIVGDKACPHGIELFDIAYYDAQEKRLYLNQVKEKLSGSTRAAAFQLMNAADAVLAIRNGDDTWLRLFAEDLQRWNPSAYKEFMNRGGIQQLKAWIVETPPKDIVFVYAMANETPKERYLEDELLLVQRLNESDFSEMANELGGKFIAKSVRDILFEKEMIDAQGRMTSKGLTCFEKKGESCFSKEMAGKMDADKASQLYASLKPLVATKFNSSIPRFSLHKAAQHIKKQGFSFAISQIRHEKAPSRDLPLKDALETILSLPALPKVSSEACAPGSTFIHANSEKEKQTYTLQPTLDENISALHAVLGGWQQDLQTVGWNVQGETSREILVQAFADTLRKKVDGESESKEKPWSTLIRTMMLRLVNYRVPTRGAIVPMNAASLWKWIGQDEERQRIASLYIAKKRKSENQFQDLEVDEQAELVALEACLDDLKTQHKGRASEHPNNFAAALKGKKQMDQKQRLQMLAAYDKDAKLWKKDYRAHRESVRTYLLANAKTENETALQLIFQAQDSRAQCEEEFDKLEPVNLFLDSLLGKDRVFGLEEAELAAHLYEGSIELLTLDDKQQPKILFSKEVKSDNSRVVFASMHLKNQTFFACSLEGERPILQPSQPEIAVTAKPTLKKELPKKIKRENDLDGVPKQFPAQNGSYMPVLTAGLGACFLHAALGTKQKSEYRLGKSDAEARNLYCLKLEEAFKKPSVARLNLFAKILSESNKAGEFGANRQVWHQQPAFNTHILPLIQRLEQLENERMEASKKQVEALMALCQFLLPAHVANRKQLLELIGGKVPSDPDAWRKICYEHRTALLNYFQENPLKTPQGKALKDHLDHISANIQDIDTSETTRKAQFETLAQTEAIQEMYRNVVMADSYWLTDADASLLADIYDISLSIYGKYRDSYSYVIPPINDQAANKVVIFWQRTDNKGYHYWRCEEIL